MDKEFFERELRIMKLEDGIEESIHTIEFLHGCLTDPNYKYSYPEQTLQHLKNLEQLYKPIEGCFHSMRKKECPSCLKTMLRIEKMRKLEGKLNGK